MSIFSVFSGQALAQPAVQPALDPVDAVNQSTGYPPTERYPGSLDPAEYTDAADQGTFPTTPGGPDTATAEGPEPFASSLPLPAAGESGYQDAGWMSGHDGPQVAWDSSAGAPFAPSGAVNPVLHGTDTGGVFVKEYVVAAGIGSLTRRTQPGQTTVRNGSGDQVTKDNVVSPNGRSNLDQYQYHNPDGYDPWLIPYAERPIQNTLAYEATPITPTGTQYGPSGYLPDRSPLDYSAQAYEAPPDPSVGLASQGATDSGIGGGWV